MNSFFSLSALVLMLASVNSYAHLPATDIVDEEIYLEIDTLVTDTPDATLNFDDRGNGMTQSNITAHSLETLETLIVLDLFEYVEQIDGKVDFTISFTSDRSVNLTIISQNKFAPY
jgi:hypothetical protein